MRTLRDDFIEFIVVNSYEILELRVGGSGSADASAPSAVLQNPGEKRGRSELLCRWPCDILVILLHSV